MSTPTPPVPEAEVAPETVIERTALELVYPAASGVEGGAEETVRLVGNQARDPVRARGRVRDAIPVREALSALYAVVASDMRYVPKDRTAWLALKAAKQSSAGSQAWEARREYFAWLSRNDPTAFLALDPIVSVFPDQIAFEVFSKDEASYARLSLDRSALEVEGDWTCGTTNIDFSDALYGGLQQLRSYRATVLSVGEVATPEGPAVGVETTGAPPVLEKKIQVPDTWLRGFLQVQSAATLPMTRFSLAPIDLYNVLRHLRLHADQKRKGRGLRVELIPGEKPRIVLEPWEEVFPTHGAPYAGRSAQVIRVWGRRRLELLRRFLPFIETIDVSLLGSGLPSFWVMKGGPITLTLGMSGFVAANWAQAVSFDLLLPRRRAASPHASKVLDARAAARSATVADLATRAGVTPAEALDALQRGCLSGLVSYDLAAGLYRHRPLLGVPLDLSRFEYRNSNERVAHDLLAVAGAVRIDTENRIPGSGLELVGRVAVEADRREYRPQILVDEEDQRVKKAECTCAFYRKHALKEGPCPHMVALLALHAQEEAKRRAGRATGRAGVVVETRTYVRRDAQGEEMLQLSLNHRRVSASWGPRGGKLRNQNLHFDTPDAARAAYFARVDTLESRGYLDTSAG